jgi:putative tricarboxylic transport membrane protein
LKSLGIYLSIFFLICSGGMFWLALSMDYYSEYGPGAGFLPLWVNGVIFILSVFYLVIVIKKKNIPVARIFPKGEGFINVLVSMGSPVLFLIIVSYVGFVLSSFITLFILFMLGYKWYWSLGSSAVVTFILFWVFGTLLQVPLPVNQFGW